MMGLPEGYTTRAPAHEDAEAVAALISACQIADTGASDMSVEEMLDDWHTLDLAEEAVAVIAQDGTIAAYADVINRSFVTVSVYGYVHPDYREAGAWQLSCRVGRALDARAHATCPTRTRASSCSITSTRPTKRRDDCWRTLGYTPVRGIYVMETTLDEAPPPATLARGYLRAHLRPQPGRACGLRGRRGRVQGHVGPPARHFRAVRQG